MKYYNELISKSILNEPDSCTDPSNPEEWAKFCFFITAKLLSRIRERRFDIEQFTVGSKGDGSPFTKFEYEIEEFCRAKLHKFYSDAHMLGEESSTSFDMNGDLYLFVIDPIDGTRAFLSTYDTYSITITIIKDKKPKFSLVANPSTGDIAFRIGNDKSHIASLSMLKDEILVYELPIINTNFNDALLLNIHPSPVSKKYFDRFYALWSMGSVSLVKSVSGSPSWQIIEASKGGSIYLNSWTGGITMPFDLVSAFHILEGAGGIAYNLDGSLTDPWTNDGPFIAGSDFKVLSSLMEQL
jgi:fructose-1,6-bisphosphatase/inositol monophosphatase family enzyme